jgi:CheY-like chemotaxis protein
MKAPLAFHVAIILDSKSNSYFTFIMALRVLLADESSTIKKVMHLALSDFAVEVKTVPVGLDVLAVSKSFKPDIIFADVLLAKRSGYDVCSEIKNDPEMNQTPVVLMWSGFMELDENKARESKADERLEKPFDADRLREIVKNLVHKTKSNPISDFLSFPEMPEFEESSLPSQRPKQKVNEEAFLNPEVDLVDEEFAAVPLTDPRPIEDNEDGGWTRQDLTKFKINLPEGDSEVVDFASKFAIPLDKDLSHANIEVIGDFEEVTFEDENPKPEIAVASTVNEALVSKVERSVKDQMLATLQKNLNPSQSASNAEPNIKSNMDLSTVMVETLVREEVRGVIESVCWKIIPEIAERIVRDEINKILKETEL